MLLGEVFHRTSSLLVRGGGCLATTEEERVEGKEAEEVFRATPGGLVVSEGGFCTK